MVVTVDAPSCAGLGLMGWGSSQLGCEASSTLAEYMASSGIDDYLELVATG